MGVDNPPPRECSIGYILKPQHHFTVACAVFLLSLLISCEAAAQTSANESSESSTGLSGYMDFHFNKPEHEDATIDFHRFVLLVTHRFSDRIRFVGELELEHAFVEGLEEGGELELEQAYVDFLISRQLNVRAGMLLMPIGIINERHEPPVFYGVERPFVDTFIVPTTWFEAGAGVHGEVGRGWRYRTFVAAPLNAREFSADEGLREGRQKGSEANIGRPAGTGRLEYVGVRGLTLGASFWAGRSGFEFRPRFDVPVKVGEFDARYTRGPLELRGQFAQVSISNAKELNDALGRSVGVDPNIARSLRGFYGEAGYRFWSTASSGEFGAFVRYRELRYAVPDARRLRAAQAVRPRCHRLWPHLLARSRHRHQDRLLGDSESEPDDHGTQRVQRRTRMVVLMEILFMRSGVLLVLTLGTALSSGSSPRAAAAQAERIEIVAERFSFSPSEFRVKAGVPVEISLRSDDTDHGFRILETDVNVRIPKRGKGPLTITFQPPAPGRYTFECSHVCGAGHAFMRGTIIVQ